MRIFLAGASGVIGQRFIPLAIQAGHHVTGMTRSARGAEVARSLGADAVVCDVFDAPALHEIVRAAAPELVMHQLTDLPDDPARIRDFAKANARIRREGTRNLLDAARAAGVRRFVAQSVAWEVAGDGGAAVADLEYAVLEYGGVVVRYGQLYGPATYHSERPANGPVIEIGEAARRTIEALDEASGVITVVEAQ